MLKVSWLSGVRALWVIVFLIAMPASVAGKPLQLLLTDSQLNWIGEQVFRNECGSRKPCLVHWNEGEAFPSLGIGHFIWYPDEVDGRFVESFPALVRYMKSRSVTLPDWLEAEEVPPAPWEDRAMFRASANSTRVEDLRNFLANTKGIQAEFIVHRAQASLERVLNAVPAGQRPPLRDRIAALGSTPGGTYALIDYVNFKGEGLAESERYHGQGWGLLQVLQAMSGDPDQSALSQFREAAGQILTRRATNADQAIERERWLPGWLNRLDTYREPDGEAY